MTIPISRARRRTGATHWLVAALVLSKLAVLEPVDAGAEIAAAVNGTAADAEFSATFTVQRFIVDTGRLVAEGTLTDIPKIHAGPATTLPKLGIAVTGISRSCATLRVDLGPLDVSVRGARVHLNDFALHVSDPGNGPLREVLCAIGDAPDDVTTLRPLLNEMLDIVGCLMRGAGGCARKAV